MDRGPLWRAFFLSAIYADDQAIGFVMLELDPGKAQYYLWRYMIDKQHQGHGYGRQALELVIEFVRRQPIG
ncbi:MAG: GNAT family N-acetyltransferase [Halioglobus sp.]